ncbi:ferrichrome outer membrane transporter [Geobacter sp. OR-1]|uniref:TonB-dependent receptor plug domain-containing protein n=1 Tax=Geobacter sp. OR-1 TaxID=1266765 RepID=UPI000542CA2F|nr:TonB-dependent receptor [Geobacter sp. OR-1]GAM10233.1 ferrichrome outer membrane transporter [Geobacter sp. OR-1]
MVSRSSGVALFLCMSMYAADSAWALERNIYDLSLEKLSDLVVTDSKIAQSQETVTQKVELFYPEEFEQQTTYNRNIAELLQYTSGQFVNVLSRNDANWGSFGGLGPKYNGYLLDGLPIDSFVDAMSLDPWAFGQVEIHKGPASVMYSNYLTMDFAGNETPLAGITNFILKDRIDAPATRFLVGGGSYNTFAGRLYHQDRKENLNYFIGAGYEQSDYTDYGTANSWLNIIKDPEYQKTKLYAKLTYLFDRDDHKLSVFAHHTQHTGDAGRPNRDFNHKYDTINATYTNQINEAINLQVKTGYRNYDRRWGEDNFPANLGLRERDGVEQQIFPSDLTINVSHYGNSLLTAGADSQVATYRSFAEVNGVRSTGTDVNAYSVGLFLQEKLVLGRWVLRGGGRFNYTDHSYDLFNGVTPAKRDNSWNTFLWSVGARCNMTPWLAFYGNAGSSFVAPSAKQLGGTLNAADAGVAGRNGQLPSLDLKPEKGIGSDLGVDLRPLDNLIIGIRGFYNQIDDAIVENAVNATPSQSRSMNAGNAYSYGFELNLDHRFSDYLRSFANLTYTATKVENPLDSDQDGADISFVPDYVANAGITSRLPWGISVSPYLHLVGTYFDSTSKSGRSKFGPYHVLNIRAQKILFKSADYALNAAVDLNNLFDKRYEMPWQFRDPGFNAFGSLELTF